MQVQSPKTSGNRNRVSGFLRLFVFSLLTAAFSFTSLHAQTVAYVSIPGSSRGGGNNLVSVIDTSTNTVTATITVGLSPVGIVFSPDGTRAFVLNGADSTISVIDTASNTVTATIPLGGTPFGGGSIEQPAITPDGKTLYSPDANSSQVFVVSTQTNSVVAAIPVSTPVAVAITPDGSRAYVQELLGQVAVIDTSTNTVTTSIASPGFFPNSIAIMPGGANVYVPGGIFANFAVISTSNNTVAATIPLPGDPIGGIVFSPDGSKAYIADTDTGNVDVVDTNTNTVEPAPITIVGGIANFLAVTPDGAFLYVTSLSSSQVSVVSTATNTVVATVPLVDLPSCIAIATLHTPMATLSIENLVINSNLHEQGDFTLAANSSGIDLAHQPVTIAVNNFSLTIPAGSFKQVGGNMHFVFNGTVNGLKVNFNIQAEHGSSTQFDFVFDVHGVSITGPNPANVSLGIGPNTGSTTAPF